MSLSGSLLSASSLLVAHFVHPSCRALTSKVEKKERKLEASKVRTFLTSY